jgi:hypothetical protein
MIKIKLTSFNGNTKTISMPNEYLTKKYLSELHNNLPKVVTLQVSCDALGISGHLKGNK